MVDVRCPNFNDTIWSYVAEYAKRKGISRCEALEQIVIEHMKVLAEVQRKLYEKGRKNVGQ
jgi:hypothetical protein